MTEHRMRLGAQVRVSRQANERRPIRVITNIAHLPQILRCQVRLREVGVNYGCHLQVANGWRAAAHVHLT
jgi:hypothetical protein